jgi:hypothetical protein
MPEQADASLKRTPESNAEYVARCLVYPLVDLDGSGVVQVLELLRVRAEQILSLNHELSELDNRVARQEITSQEEYNAVVLEGLYETTCLKWFLACVLRELGTRLESEVFGAQICMNPIRQITFAPDGQVESFLLDFPEVRPGGDFI